MKINIRHLLFVDKGRTDGLDKVNLRYFQLLNKWVYKRNNK